MPQRNRLRPTCWRPATNPGPALMPTMAMKTFRPSVFISTSAGVGMRPKVGRIVRRYPRTRPASSAPPDVERPIGMPPNSTLRAPMRPPTRMPPATVMRSVDSSGRSANAQRLDRRLDVADAAGDGQDVAAQHLRLRQDRHLDHVPGDPAEVDAAREGLIGQLAQRLAAERLVCVTNTSTTRCRQVQQRGVVDLGHVGFDAARPAAGAAR